MPGGGYRPGAGRPPNPAAKRPRPRPGAPKGGTPRTIAADLCRLRREVASAAGGPAAEHLMRVVNDPTVEERYRVSAAMALLPYQEEQPVPIAAASPVGQR